MFKNIMPVASLIIVILVIVMYVMSTNRMKTDIKRMADISGRVRAELVSQRADMAALAEKYLLLEDKLALTESQLESAQLEIARMKRR